MLDVAHLIMLWVCTMCSMIFTNFRGTCCLHIWGDWICFKWMLMLQQSLDSNSFTLKVETAYSSELSNQTFFFTWFKNSETHLLNNSVHFLLTSMNLFQWLHHYLKWMQKSCSLNASKQSLIVPECWLSNPLLAFFISSLSVVEVCSGDHQISCFRDLSTVHGMWCHKRCSKESKTF